MKRIKKTALCLLIFSLMSAFAVTAQAQSTDGDIPVETYTYWEDVGSQGSRKTVYTHPTYMVEQVITAQKLGVSDFAGLNDVFADKNGIVYLLDGDGSRLIITDDNFNLIKEITSVISPSETYSFNGAESVYVHTDGTIYLCDTNNERVLLFDQNGNFKAKLTLPESSLIPTGFQYKPIAITVDSTGHIYVLCDGSYYGALLYTPEYEFIGFYGSNKVSNSVTQALSSMMSRLFVNNTKKSATASVLPYAFSDLCVDKNDFIYTATGFTDVGQTGQIKKLSPGNGANIINSDDVNFIDEGSNWSYNLGAILRQDISSISVDEYGFIYCLDTAFGRVFIYDEEGHLLSAFAGGIDAGEQEGLFKQATALAVNDQRVLVSDKKKKSVTVFKETEYGSNLKKARYLTMTGSYAESKDIWNSVIAEDSNCQLAYEGLARAYLNEGDYDSALSYAKEGYDRDTYELAFSKVRTRFISNNFAWLLILGIVLIVGLLSLMVVSMKKKVVLVKNQKVSLMFSAMAHPFAVFETLKEKKLGSAVIGAVLIVLHYITTVLSDLCCGLSFKNVDLANYNSIWVVFRSTGLVVLWIICNKLVTTLINGKGKTFDIFIVTAYSLLPAIIGNVVFLIFSNVLVSTEAEFLTMFRTLMLIYSLLMIAIGTIKIHDYSMKEFVGTTLLTVLGMAIVVFLIIMIFILAQQFIAFLATLYLEII